MKKSASGGNLSKGLSFQTPIGSKDTTAKASSTGRVKKQPMTSVGKGCKIKGNM